MPRYHPKLFLPAGLTLPGERHGLRPNQHAIEQARNDGVEIPDSINSRACICFEMVTCPRGRLIKLGLRTVLDKEKDLCLMVALDGRVWTVLTVWVNDREDWHDSLRSSEYTRS